MTTDTEEQRKIEREYEEFLDDEADQGIYYQLVKNMIEDKGIRLIVNINDLRRKYPKRAQNLLNNSFEEIVAFQSALKKFVSDIDNEYSKTKEEFYIGFEGSFGNKHVTPRSLTCRYLGNLVCVEGIVTKSSLVYQKLVRSVHYCPATKKYTERKYTDLTSYDAFPSYAAYPTHDDENNPLETEYGLSSYKDHQIVYIQEMPEKAPAGHLPRTVDIVCDYDLVDSCKPGDRIQVVGNYRLLPNQQGNYTSGIYRTIVIANNIKQLSKDANLTLTAADVAESKKFSKENKDVFSLLAKSLAPSIHGHEYVKKAILCLLLGGVEKVLPSGTRLRGDINVLLIGDPSVAKSQLLRYVLGTAPRAIATTGRGSSGVGLTAAVTTDSESGERRLEAGAMVLADRGVVCIDEFDKMSDIDRTAIHEVMEQGRVTIAKAGVHASLNARCSVLAAANPVYGKYNSYKTPMENIGLQDSLLSRFDLLFVMLDTVDEFNDLKISDHVIRMHRYRNPLEQDGEVTQMDANVDLLSTINLDEEDRNKETPMYEKYDPLLHGKSRSKKDKILSVEFVRKYIQFVKILKPKLTDEASSIIADEYAKLRSEEMLNGDVARTLPVTARTLETMIRLATAHAKARTSKLVEKKDAQAAIELVQFAYFKKVLEKKKKRPRRDSVSEDEEIIEDDDEDQVPKRPRRRSQSVTQTQESTNGHTEPETTQNGDTEVDTMEIDDNSQQEISGERLTAFKLGLEEAFRGNLSGSISLVKAKEFINKNNATPFTQGEIMAALERMTEDNQVMLTDGIIFRI